MRLKSLKPLKPIVFVLVALLGGVAVAADLPPAQNYTLKKSPSKIKIDGILDEEAWKNQEKIDIKYEWMPGDNIEAPVKSECMVTYDNSKLYVAFRCFDPNPEKIRAHLMDRDATDTLVQDDHVTLMIDTFNDERRAFQFRVNPLGVQADAIFSGMESFEDFTWDAIWSSAGRITDFGYVVELAIPFNQLRFPRGKGVLTWGLSAERSYPRNVRHRMSSHVRNRNNSCLLCQLNKLTGFAGISPGKNLEFDPTLTARRTDQRTDFPSGDLDSGTAKFEPGISARWGITPNVMLNATVNPDFSHVEADAQQLEVNTRFALRYPEKRPFFLESADFFLTPLEAVFTRTVYDPLWGGKLTGKIGKNAIGFFSTMDRHNNLLFPSNQGTGSTSLDDNVLGGVFRFRRDVGKGSTVGVLYTGRSGDDYYNHAGGVDGYFRLSRTNVLSVQYLRSRSRYPDAVAQSYNQPLDAFDGDAIHAVFAHRSRHLISHVRYQSMSPGFRADSGFIPRVDTRMLEFKLNPILWGKKGGWFNRLGLMLLARNITDTDNNLTDRMVLVAASYMGPMQSYVETDLYLLKEFYNGISYDLNRAALYTVFTPVKGIKTSFYMRMGDSIDYYNSRPARSLQLMPDLEFSLGKHLNVNLSHIFERLFVQGNTIYRVNMLQSKFVYNLNVRTFLRAIFQYTHIKRNIENYLLPVPPLSKGLFTQLLFSYKINPHTVLLLGYSDNQSGWKGLDLTRTNRTFFLKIGYALVQ